MPAATPLSPSKAMRQSVLSFRPRTSSSLIEAIVLSDSDEEASSSKKRYTPSSTPAQASRSNGKQAHMTPPLDDRDEIDFTTPPLMPNPNSQRPADEDDDELSDPPPLGPKSPKQVKKLTKKRPSSGESPAARTNAASGPSKKIKSDTAKSSPGTSNGHTDDTKQTKKLAAWGDGPLCHHHRSACQTEMIRCTMMRPNGQRCALKYCDRALKTHYDESVENIMQKGQNEASVDAQEHEGGEKAPFYFKCPRCQDRCQCSLCRKKGGLAPLGGFKNRKDSMEVPSKADGGNTASPASPSTSSISAAKSSPKPSNNQAKPAATVRKVSTTGDKKAAPQAKAKAKAKATASSPSVSEAKVVRQTSLSRPLKAPTPVPAPELQVIDTILKPDNIWARIWIYETLVRFDFIKVPKATLSQLDKFDSWTHRQMQLVLERIIVAVAGLNNIHSNSAQPKTKTTRVVKAYREFGNDLKRGEPWQAARDLCENVGALVPSLPHIERSFDDEGNNPANDRDDTPADHEPTLLGSRLTRTRRAAEVRALERVKLQSLADYESMESSSSDEGELPSDDDGGAREVDSDREDWEQDDDEDAPPTRSSSRKGAQRDRVVSEGSRRSGRQRQAPSSVIADTAAASAGQRKSSRQIVAINASDSTSGSSDRSTATPAPEVEDADNRPTELTPPAETGPAPAPEMEEKIAIICGLLEAVMQTPEVAEELKAAAVRLPAIEKARQEELKEHEKEWEEIKKEIWTSAPSMIQADNFNKWKTQKEKKEKNFKMRILDTRVNAYKETEANKLRTGPLGVDADGRVYWQLTEFNENMPAHTLGRWAWCVLIYGEPMTKHAPPPEAMPANAPNISPLKAGAATEEKAQPESDAAKVEAALFEPRQNDDDGDTSMVVLDPPKTPMKGEGQNGALQGQEESSNSSLSSPSPLPDEGKVFMGTNYPASITSVIDFIKYRCVQLDYEEAKAQREQELRAQNEKVDQANGGSSSPRKSGGDLATPVGRKAKRQLKEAQEARKAQVDELCQKLENCRTYYMWHGGEVDPGDPAGSI